MNEQEINEIFAQQIQSINAEIATPTEDTNNKNGILLFTLSLIKLKPELFSQLEQDHKKFVEQLLDNCMNAEFNIFLRDVNIEDDSDLVCARNELMNLSYYYNQAHIESTRSLIEKIKKSVQLTLYEFTHAQRISDLETFLRLIPSDDNKPQEEWSKLDKMRDELKTCFAKVSPLKLEDSLLANIQTIFQVRNDQEPISPPFTNRERCFIQLLSIIERYPEARKQLTPEHKAFLSTELKNCIGNTALNKKIKEFQAAAGSNAQQIVFSACNNLSRLSYKSRKHDEATTITSKITTLSKSISYKERKQNKLSLAEFGIAYDLKDTHPILKKYIDIIDDPEIDQELTTMVQQTKQCTEFAKTIDQLYQRDFQAPAGTIVLDNLRKKSDIQGWQLSWTNSIMDMCITKYGHASVLFSPTPDAYDPEQSNYEISHINPISERREFDLRNFLYSEQYHIQPEKLISANNLLLLQQKHGANWKKYLHDKLRDIERQIHDDTVSNFHKVYVSAEKQYAMAREVVFTAGLAHKQIATNDFSQIHEQVMGIHYQVDEEHSMICSEFVAHTTIASLFELNNQLKTDLGLESDVLKIPFSQHENIANISPERLLVILKEADCVQQYVVPDINRYIETKPTKVTTFISDHSLTEIQMIQELAITHIETLKIYDLEDEFASINQELEILTNMLDLFNAEDAYEDPQVQRQFSASLQENEDIQALYQLAENPDDKDAIFYGWVDSNIDLINTHMRAIYPRKQEVGSLIDQQYKQMNKIATQSLDDMPGLFKLCEQAIGKDNKEGQRLIHSLKQKIQLEEHSKNVTLKITTREHEDLQNRESYLYAAWQWLISCVGSDNRSKTKKLKKLQSNHLRTYNEIIQKLESAHQSYGSDIEEEKRKSICHLEILSSNADEIIRKMLQIAAKESNIEEFTLEDHAYALALDEYLKSKDCLLSSTDKKRIHNNSDFSKIKSLHQTKTQVQNDIYQIQHAINSIDTITDLNSYDINVEQIINSALAKINFDKQLTEEQKQYYITTINEKLELSIATFDPNAIRDAYKKILQSTSNETKNKLQAEADFSIFSQEEKVKKPSQLIKKLLNPYRFHSKEQPFFIVDEDAYEKEKTAYEKENIFLIKDHADKVTLLKQLAIKDIKLHYENIKRYVGTEFADTAKLEQIVININDSTNVHEILGLCEKSINSENQQAKELAQSIKESFDQCSTEIIESHATTILEKTLEIIAISPKSWEEHPYVQALLTEFNKESSFDNIQKAKTTMIQTIMSQSQMLKYETKYSSEHKQEPNQEELQTYQNIMKTNHKMFNKLSSHMDDAQKAEFKSNEKIIEDILKSKSSILQRLTKTGIFSAKTKDKSDIKKKKEIEQNPAGKINRRQRTRDK